MTERRKNSEKLLEYYYRIANSILHFQNIPLSFNGSIPLRTAPIHLIDMIGKHPYANLTELAEKLGITKGAVSQMSASLIKKGILKKSSFEGNSKNVRFELTDEGWKIYNGHEIYHHELYQKLDALLEDFSPKELEKFLQVLTVVSETMQKYEKEN